MWLHRDPQKENGSGKADKLTVGKPLRREHLQKCPNFVEFINPRIGQADITNMNFILPGSIQASTD